MCALLNFSRRAFHQKCLVPAVTSAELAEEEQKFQERKASGVIGDEQKDSCWFCRACGCFLNNILELNSSFSVNWNSWQEVVVVVIFARFFVFPVIGMVYTALSLN